MLPVPILEFLLFFVSLLLEAALVGMVVAWGWALTRIARGLALFPRDAILPLPTARWGFATVILVILLHLGAGSAAGVACRELFGIDLRKLIAREKPAVAAADLVAEDEKDRQDGEVRRSATTARQLMIWNASYNALFLMAFPWVFRRVSGAGAAELGLSQERWPEQLRLGVVTGLIAAPLVYTVQFLALTVFDVNAHPIEQMLQDGFDPWLAVLALMSTVVLAPLSEEIMFRGVLQGWLTRAWSTFRSHARPIAAIAGRTSFTSYDDTEPQVLDPSPGVDPVSLRPPSNPTCWPAVVLTSILFAGLHGPQWPAPIALFVFSVIMGAVYQRSGSLLATIATHGVFNGCSTLLLLTQQLGRTLQQPAEGGEPIVVGLAAAWDSLGRILH